MSPAAASTPLPPRLRAALDRALGGERALVLAVSGGRDSMALLHAVAAWRPAGVAVVVATYDHGTGPAATAAARLVRREARRLGLPVAAARARRAGRTEDEWRRARWRFLRRVARAHGGRVVTAHTRDDQVETVAMRILRGAGARGLAGLAARGPVRRPWLRVSRAAVAAWARAAGVPHATDPSNRSRRHLRNRMRHDLLPALRAARPGIDRELLAVGAAAAAWRRGVERVARTLARAGGAPGVVHVARAGLAGYSAPELSVLWPALAALAGVRLDRRGTSRLAAFTRSGARLGRVPLADGAEVLALPERYVVRRRRASPLAPRPLGDGVRWAGWRIRRARPEEHGAGRAADGADDAWSAALPAEAYLTVRSWLPGDRIRAPGCGSARRVKRCFGDLRVAGPLRAGWPVVLADGEVVWIPGVCRSAAATDRPGRPALHFRCDRNPC